MNDCYSSEDRSQYNAVYYQNHKSDKLRKQHENGLKRAISHIRRKYTKKMNALNDAMNREIQEKIVEVYKERP
ncbi:MAG: hypothetical protein JNL32_00265 [Candidatus Kapabacteria bacterium]|nr:hypothetical protein [Candidatus Kapabacteria bacterium]